MAEVLERPAGYKSRLKSDDPEVKARRLAANSAEFNAARSAAQASHEARRGGTGGEDFPDTVPGDLTVEHAQTPTVGEELKAESTEAGMLEAQQRKVVEAERNIIAIDAQIVEAQAKIESAEVKLKFAQEQSKGSETAAEIYAKLIPLREQDLAQSQELLSGLQAERQWWVDFKEATEQQTAQ